MPNQIIKDTIKDKGLRQWQVADALGISEATFVRWMRHELADEERNRILAVIDELGGENRV